MRKISGFFLSRGRSFGHAFSGWWHVIRTQRNAWIHAVVSIMVLVLSFWLGISRMEWVMIIGAIALVWIAEFLNTALEVVVDLATNHAHHELAKVGKDVGAAAVLIAATASVVIGLVILGPLLWEKLQNIFS
jgi:diacylglycerol kinase (ATP)